MSWLPFDQLQHGHLPANTPPPLPDAVAAADDATSSSSSSSSSVLQHLLATVAATGEPPLPLLLLWSLRLLWLAVLYACYRRWLNGRGPYTDRSRSLRGRCCLVTGANSGIGLQTARELAARGARVWLACRDRERAEEARGRLVRETGNRAVLVAHVDLADLASVRRFAGEFLRKNDRLDILVNNAGVMGVPTDRCTVDGLEPHMAVNHYGAFLLTLLLLGRMRRTARRDARRHVGRDGQAVRIVNVNSCSHRWVEGDRRQLRSGDSSGAAAPPLDRFRAYAVSKLAAMLAVRGLAERLGRDGVLVNAVHPGVVHTQMPRHLGELSWLLNRHFAALFSWLFLRTARQGAQSVLYAALDMNLDYITGHYIDDLWFERPHEACDKSTEVDWFWRHSERIVGLTYEQAIEGDDADDADDADDDDDDDDDASDHSDGNGERLAGTITPTMN